MKTVLLFFLIAILISCAQNDTFQDVGQLKSAKVDDVQKNERIIVKYKDNAKIEVLHGVTDVPKELEKLKKDPGVEYAEPDVFIEIDAIPNDSIYQSGDLWNMYSAISTPKNEYGCGAADAWAKGQTGSNDIWVAIIDQGYMYSHEDLIKNAGMNPFEIPDNGIDDEGNGYIDDVWGWNWWGGNNRVDNGDSDYHGTHVAGIIGAAGNNGIGVAGVVWNVRFISAKFCGYYGGYLGDAVKAVEYVIDLRSRGLNIVAANCSWGTKERSRALQEVFAKAESSGILMICAAGNNGSNKVIAPASYRFKNIISVASINISGYLSSFSNYGKGAVDLAAPGENIISCYPYNYSGTSYFTKYYSLSGTSMAAPHVTGAAVLYKSIYPSADWLEIKNAILGNVIPTPSLASKVATGGRLNVSNW